VGGPVWFDSSTGIRIQHSATFYLPATGEYMTIASSCDVLSRADMNQEQLATLESLVLIEADGSSQCIVDGYDRYHLTVIEQDGAEYVHTTDGCHPGVPILSHRKLASFPLDGAEPCPE
jgi:hypothetical protein